MSHSRFTIKAGDFHLAITPVTNLNAVDRELKVKVQELRLYETVLMQSIHTIKSLATDCPIPDVKVGEWLCAYSSIGLVELF